MNFDVLIIGGGAAGFFTAINLAERCPQLKIAILEKGKDVLTKVKISGGGRCNITHAEFIPKDLTNNYPRGRKELLGPFHKFMTGDTMAWFEKRGVKLKIEEDGRVFPVSDSSQTVIDCFLQEIEKHNISVYTKTPIIDFYKREGSWYAVSKEHTYTANTLVLATGSHKKIWNTLQVLGHTVVKPLPSLFTFNCNDPRIKELAGVSTYASVSFLDKNGKPMSLEQSAGPVLITHWGFSGPAILKQSAWGARILAQVNYDFKIVINWLDDMHESQTLELLKKHKLKFGKLLLKNSLPFTLPKRLWISLLIYNKVPVDIKWADVTKEMLISIRDELVYSTYHIQGKSTFKEEFVTAGGVELSEIDFKTYASKLYENLYLAGEVLNIDAVTGGFNFQNAWTGGYILAEAISTKFKL